MHLAGSDIIADVSRNHISGLIIGFACMTFGLLGASALESFYASLFEGVPEQFKAVEVSTLNISPVVLDQAAEFDPNVDYENKLPVKLLLPGFYHSEEIPYRSGEKWLGLFRIGDSYILKNTKIKVQNKYEIDDLYDVEVTVEEKREPVFLLKGADNLQPGEVETNFDLSLIDEYDSSLPRTFPMSFRIKRHWWTLSTVNAPDGTLGKGSALVLEKDRGVTVRVLRYLSDGCNDCTWRVLWAGDLDHDSGLDLFIDVTDHYNVTRPTLFLSTKGVFASFRTVGC